MVKTNAIRIQVQKALTWPRLRSTRLKDVGQGGQRVLRVDNSAPDLSQLAVRELRDGSVVSVRGAPYIPPPIRERGRVLWADRVAVRKLARQDSFRM